MNKFIIIICLLLFCNTSYAEDGEVGTTSSGTSTISVTIPPRINTTVAPNGTTKVDTNVNLEEFTKVETTQGNTKIIIYIPK